MKKAKGILRALPYICLSCVIVLGLVAIVGTGGGGEDGSTMDISATTDTEIADSDSPDTEVQVFIEEIPGSTNHDPDGTWWGYNQSKIVRYGDTVFMYVIENDDDSSTQSDFRIYKKEDSGDWTSGAALSTSRPGNLVIDSSGILHAFVFEPYDISTDDSIGKLKHYTFSNAASGDITNYSEEAIVDNDGSEETVNIRIGAAIGANDTLGVAFGLSEGRGYNGYTEHLYYKASSDTSWTHSIAGENLGHDFYYPFALVRSDGFSLLAVQDDYNSGNPNIYQKVMYFEYSSSSWSNELVADLSSHSLALSREQLLGHSDLFEDSNGNIHIVYKEFLDSSDDTKVSSFKYLVGSSGNWSTTTIDLTDYNVNWLRVVEINGTIYFVAASWDQLYLLSSDASVVKEVTTPNDMSGIYPYVASPRTGTRTTESYVDILLLNGDSSVYPNASNYYYRIEKTEFSKVQ